MRAVTRRWWRAAVAGVFAAAGGYALFGPPSATAQQPNAAPVWTRASSPLSPAAASATRVPLVPGAVIPASAVLPATAQPPVPPLPALPSAPDLKASALPQLPTAPPSAPSLPALPPVAPPAPPAKSVLTAQPAASSKADSPLRQPDSGNSVKLDAAWKAPAIAPRPREATPAVPATPAARVVDRPKPPETVALPSERDEFPLPRPMVPAVPVANPLPPPTPMTPVVPPPAPTSNPVATTPGADPMTFKSAAAAAVLGGALVMPQTKADAPATGGMAEAQTNKDAPKTTDEKLADIQRDLRELTELLKGRRDDKGYPLPSNPGLAEQVRDLKDKMAALEKQLADVRNDLKSTSLRPPAGTVPGVPNPMPGGATPAPAPAAAQGTVRIVNEYPVEITMVVNSRSHRVAPNATVDVPVPVGDFSYQLLSGSTALAPTRSTIRASEVVTLRIK